MSTLIVYSTTDGHTKKISELIAQDLKDEVKVLSLDEFKNFRDYDGIDLVIFGASIRYGHYNKELVRIVKANLNWIQSIRSVFFSVNLTARKPGKNDPDKSQYVQRFLGLTQWKPDQIAMFAGVLDYSKYRFIDRQMIRLIMKITGGCTDGKSTIEYTDWEHVHRFAASLSRVKSASLG